MRSDHPVLIPTDDSFVRRRSGAEARTSYAETNGPLHGADNSFCIYTGLITDTLYDGIGFIRYQNCQRLGYIRTVIRGYSCHCACDVSDAVCTA